MNVLIFDTETTGLDPTRDHVIEVGCILFSVEHASPLLSYSSLIRRDGQPAESERINGIPSAILKTAPEESRVWARVEGLSKGVGAILAHQAEFDRNMSPPRVFGGTPWICTQDDLAWPHASGSKSLIATALAHGVGVASAHRALADCDLIARLLMRVHELGINLDAFLARGLRPKGKFRVAATGFDAARNAIAKANGFRFEDTTKWWVRTMAIEDTAALPFEVKPVVDTKTRSLFEDPFRTGAA